MISVLGTGCGTSHGHRQACNGVGFAIGCAYNRRRGPAAVALCGLLYAPAWHAACLLRLVFLTAFSFFVLGGVCSVLSAEGHAHRHRRASKDIVDAESRQILVLQAEHVQGGRLRGQRHTEGLCRPVRLHGAKGTHAHLAACAQRQEGAVQNEEAGVHIAGRQLRVQPGGDGLHSPGHGQGLPKTQRDVVSVHVRSTSCVCVCVYLGYISLPLFVLVSQVTQVHTGHRVPPTRAHVISYRPAILLSCYLVVLHNLAPAHIGTTVQRAVCRHASLNTCVCVCTAVQ
jgi:hypothetical protein